MSAGTIIIDKLVKRLKKGLYQKLEKRTVKHIKIPH